MSCRGTVTMRSKQVIVPKLQNQNPEIASFYAGLSEMEQEYIYSCARQMNIDLVPRLGQLGALELTIALYRFNPRTLTKPINPGNGDYRKGAKYV